MAQSPVEARVEAAIAREGITDADEVVKGTDDDKQQVTKTDDSDTGKSTKGDGQDSDKADDSNKSDDSKPKYDKDGKRIEEEKPADKKEDKKEEDEAKFTADDALEVDAPQTPAAPPTDSAGVQLSGAEQKYVVDNIGEPLIIRGMRGIGDDAKEVELKVFDPGQIPRDFNFASQADLLAAQQGFQRLETKAQTLLGNFRNQASQSQAQDFEKRENEGIRSDVAELQKDGDFPKFKVQPGERGFDNDPAAKQMAEVLDIMSKTNDQYMKEYQQGRPYKHIGFKEAFDTYQKVNDGKKQDTAQKEEDKERKEIADKVGSNRGMSASSIVKPTVKRGTTTRDFLNSLDARFDES